MQGRCRSGCYPNSSILSLVNQTVWSRILSKCINIPLINRPARFLQIAPWSFKRTAFTFSHRFCKWARNTLRESQSLTNWGCNFEFLSCSWRKTLTLHKTVLWFGVGSNALIVSSVTILLSIDERIYRPIYAKNAPHLETGNTSSLMFSVETPFAYKARCSFNVHFSSLVT